MAKNKKSGIKSTDLKSQTNQLRLRFYQRIHTLCDTFAGPGYFDKLPPIIVEHMFVNRYPALKAKAVPDSTIPKTKVVQFNKLMNKFISDRSIILDNGGEILLSWYLSEGLILINYVEQIIEANVPCAAEFKEAFKPYFPGTEVHRLVEDMLVELVYDTTIFLSNLNSTILSADIGMTAWFDRESQSNDVYIQEGRPEKAKVTIDGESRSIIPLSWLDGEMNWIDTRVKPSLLGFKTGSLDIPLQVYIQSHALNKLQERIDITPGIMHYMAFLVLHQPVIEHVKYERATLVSYYLSDQKIGYLLISLEETKLIIRTFLFLTNDGTPEGKKLNQLLSLDKQDKKHLMIDTLPAINAYHLDKNEHLSKLFIKAGCGSMLNLAHLKEFSITETKDKDPESILKYLSDTDYFTGLLEM